MAAASVYYDPIRKRFVTYLDNGDLGSRREGVMEGNEERPLVEEGEGGRSESRRRNEEVHSCSWKCYWWIPIVILICAVVLIPLIYAVVVAFSKGGGGGGGGGNSPKILRLLSLNAWGIPDSEKKEDRMSILSNVLNYEKYDIFLLQGLWMEADHDLLSQSIPNGYYMTQFRELASSFCDGRVSRAWCSGLSIVTHLNISSVSFNVYTYRGTIFTTDGTLGKGVGQVRLSLNGTLIDIFNTHIHDYDDYYRDKQTKELIESYIDRSKASVIILGIELNNDPYTVSYKNIETTMTNAVSSYDPDHWSNTSIYATIGDDGNSFSNPKRIVDYVWFKAAKEKDVKINKFWKPHYKGDKISVSPHETLAFEFQIQSKS